MRKNSLVVSVLFYKQFYTITNAVAIYHPRRKALKEIFTISEYLLQRIASSHLQFCGYWLHPV